MDADEVVVWIGAELSHTIYEALCAKWKKKPYVTLCLSVSLSSHLSDILSANI